MTSADRDAGQVNSRPRPVKQREKSGLNDRLIEIIGVPLGFQPVDVSLKLG